MPKINHMITIAIDATHSAFHFYSMIGDDKQSITHQIKNYSGELFSDEFWEKFRTAVKDFTVYAPSETMRKITVLLPDSAVLTDTVKIPAMRGLGQAQKTLDNTLGGFYRNYSDLQVSAALVSQNKLYSIFAISAVQKRIAAEIYTACSENHLLVETLTYASSAAAGAVTALNPKLRKSSFLLLDIKDVYSRFVFVAGGKAVGCYTLPFGLEFLRKPKVTQEDMLFDHSYGELVVLNAKEKAKSKKLTVMAAEDEAEAEAEAEVETVAEEVAPEENASPDKKPLKIFTRKLPRKLPKFMLREAPETREGVMYENFRVFVKWALSLITGNERLTSIGAPECVYVNLPSDMALVIDMANREGDSLVPFARLDFKSEDMVISNNLELYGGFCGAYIAASSKF